MKRGLQSYAAILYYRNPPGFRIILRGQDVRHHNLAEDLMYTQELSYKPQCFESSRDVKVQTQCYGGLRYHTFLFLSSFLSTLLQNVEFFPRMSA